MKIFKFGGASVKSAEAVKNMLKILGSFKGERLVLVISAMGKTTNAIEQLIEARWEGKEGFADLLNPIFEYHQEIIDGLFKKDDAFHEEFDAIKNRMIKAIHLPVTQNYDFEYDRIAYFGEIISTKIVSEFLFRSGKKNKWLEALKLIKTNNNYREASVHWEVTKDLVSNAMKNCELAVIQGFIGHTEDGYVTTLGREGSDFTAAIMAWCLDAENVIIWKDVPGILNADPKYFPEAQKLEKISYREALELSYYGASVIHPKTIKPLQNKEIPLYVRSFLDLNGSGTLVQKSDENDAHIPSYIFKKNQVLISISTRDFSFVIEEHLEDIFGIYNRHKVRINLMQNSALNFTICSDADPHRVGGLIEELKRDYRVLFNEGLELLTIRHYNDEVLNKMTRGKDILVDQRSRVTARMVIQ
ncbi:MAG: aspartate kinase [Flavobacteriales bacterium]|nr:aspartate kinase [Flavobacteriales bacterium]